MRNMHNCSLWHGVCSILHGVCSLEHLELSCQLPCRLVSSAVSQLTGLRNLELVGRLDLKFPADMSCLQRLWRLHIEMCDGMQLLSAIRTLPRLRTLVLGGDFEDTFTLQPFKDSKLGFPAQLGCLSSSLDTLYVCVERFPGHVSALSQLQKLTSLLVVGLVPHSDSIVEQLGDALACLTSLQDLDLSDCQLQLCPSKLAGLSTLTKLALNNVPLKPFTCSLAAWSQLQELDLVIDLPSLPTDLSRLTALQILSNDSKSNSLQLDGPLDWIDSMPHLTILDLFQDAPSWPSGALCWLVKAEQQLKQRSEEAYMWYLGPG